MVRRLVSLVVLAALCCNSSPIPPKLGKNYNLSNLVQTYLDMGIAKYWIPTRHYEVVVVDYVFKPRGFKKVDDAREATLLWLNHDAVYDKGRKWMAQDGKLLINFLRGHGSLTTKELLVRQLGAVGTSYVHPPSHVINDPATCATFLAEHASRCTRWVSKESALAEGYGIKVLGNLDGFKKDVGYDGHTCAAYQLHREQYLGEIKKSYENDGGDWDYEKGTPFVMQCHIDRPFLLDRKKTEMRFYWVIASLNPLIAFLHNEGTVRLSTSDFEHGDWDNALKHIGNTKQQKLADPDAYQKDPHSRKQTFSQLETFLRSSGRISSQPGVWTKQLLSAMAHALKKAVAGSAARFWRKNTFTRHFLLLGADCLLEDTTMDIGEGVPRSQDGPGNVMKLDGGFRVWLTEVQDGPGLSVDSEVKEKMIPAMLTDVVNLVLEVDHRKMHGLPLDNFHSAGNFIPVVGTDDYFREEETGPEGWFSEVDPGGKMYYWNDDVNDGKPQWERPAIIHKSEEL